LPADLRLAYSTRIEDDMLKIEFADIEEDRAALLAQGLRRKLIEHGAKPDDLVFVGGAKSNMSIGSVLEIVSQINLISSAETGLHIAVIAHCLYDLLRRQSVTVIANGRKRMEIKPSAMSVEELSAAIQQVVQGNDDT
jgi:hypothetical protein